MSLSANGFSRAPKLTADAHRCYRKKCKCQAVDSKTNSGFRSAVWIFPLLIAAVIAAVIPGHAKNAADF